MKDKTEYRRIMVTRCGWAIVPSNSDAEALEKVKSFREGDFDWEPMNNGLLCEAEVVEICGEASQLESE